ncbi:MAG TPA: thiamine phosphate synthase [Sphingomicrobium sp.]|jgi:thiamine-phosphate pyrophosphorylase|nr:thiamine phosphate synthase [Sphingomicrobium sp.]
MSRRQTVPAKWLIVAGGAPIGAAKRLPRGSGLLLLQEPPATEMRRLRILARERQLQLVIENRRTAARVHDGRELRKALLARSRLIFLSPLFPTSTHPDWKPAPRMRAAALARLGGRRLIALGGMNERRYAKVAPLGFVGWAGVSAWAELNTRRR